ncbi:MAG: (2Fe-2S) ferredoxin [Nitrospinaceae bacterium]|nr:MAG: (2Fe-2S) ferredoxin [Nitrospinaceae bacterium]
MSKFIPVARVEEIPPDARKRVEVQGKKISIFNIEGQYYAIFDTCPHKKTAPLIRGTLDGFGIKCPNHGYRFDLKTGDCNIDPALKTQVFPVEVQGEDICVRVE